MEKAVTANVVAGFISSFCFLIVFYGVKLIYKVAKRGVTRFLGVRDKTNQKVVDAMEKLEKRIDHLERMICALPPVCGPDYLEAKQDFADRQKR